jgi:hypothetical protein
LSFFPISAPAAAPAQSPDMSLLSALCSDDYYEDTAGDCSTISAGEVFTLEAILKKYGAIITRDTDDEVLPRTRLGPKMTPAPRPQSSRKLLPPKSSMLNRRIRTATGLSTRLRSPARPLGASRRRMDRSTTTARSNEHARGPGLMLTVLIPILHQSELTM